MLPTMALWFFFGVFILLPVFFVFTTIRPSEVKELFDTSSLFTVIRNTALICLCSTVLSVTVGYIYAYAVIRGNLPFKNFFALLPLVHMITPPFVGGLSFILLFGRQGFITKTLLGMDLSLYGFSGLLLSQTLCFFPVAYLICLQAVEGINPSIEQAAVSMGAGRWKVFKTVTLPLSSAGISSALLFIAVSVLSDFGNPLIAGGRFKVLSVEIYTQLTGWLNTGKSAFLGLLLLLPSLFLFILQNTLYRKNAFRFATIGGKASSFSGRTVSRTAHIVLTAFCTFIVLLIIAQLLSLIAGSFQQLWGLDTTFTLKHLKAALSYKQELLNSLFFALAASLISVFIASLTAFITHRTDFPLKRGLNSVCQLPSAIPGTLFGLSLAYTSKLLHIRCSAFLIIMTMAVSYLPFSYRICSSAYARLKTTLDDAALSLGAGYFKVFLTVTAPLSTGALFSAFVYNFVRGAGTLSAVIFLVSFNTNLASVKILNLAEQGDWGKAAALALVLTFITFIIVGTGKFCGKCLEREELKQYGK